MPFVQIYLMGARTEEQKRRLIERVSQMVVEAAAARHW